MDNETYMTKMASAFLAELSEIEKQGFNPMGVIRGVGTFLGKGARHIKSAVTQKTPMGMTTAGGITRRIGGEGAVAAGGIGSHIKQIYQRGAKAMEGPLRPGQSAGGGVLGGLKQVAGSRYGRMAAVGAIPVAGAYALS
jgi:hypothetical protein